MPEPLDTGQASTRAATLNKAHREHRPQKEGVFRLYTLRTKPKVELAAGLRLFNVGEAENQERSTVPCHPAQLSSAARRAPPAGERRSMQRGEPAIGQLR